MSAAVAGRAMADTPGYADIEAAAARLAGMVHRTPVLRSRTLDARLGAEIRLKCESFQRAGAFKFRGACNALSLLTAEQRARGAVTHSSGNHAQALALAGRELGVGITVVMPSDAPAAKRAAAEGYGATVVEYDPATGSREAISAEFAERTGATLVPPFDHPDIIAGQGTAAAELLQDFGPLDWLLVPCGGGGLLAGSALAAAALAPGCRVIGVEPEGADDANRSFASGRIERVDRPRTIADGLRTPSLGEHTFAVIRARVEGMRTVTEAAIVEAMRWLFERQRVVVEPSGAVALAALLDGVVPARGRVGVIISGGNVDLGNFCGLLSRGP
jgi:threo-3-hydroxy-L-aspartate ammonia-lyase